MTGSRSLKTARRALSAALLATTLLAGTPALSQVTTAQIRGTVSAGESPATGVRVSARNVDTGALQFAPVGPTGAYVLSGMRPGTYDIAVVNADGTGGPAQRVIVSVGETSTLDIDTAAPAEAAAAPGEDGNILVVGTRLGETRTSEIGTNVSADQIQNLPQNNRNFLNFAALAPGIRVLQTEFRQTFGGAGVGVNRDGDSFGGPQVNVFIDGVSLRSNINQGGIVGQDVSRGNPFSQLAVAEFRVLTSNFKAEYEDAGTSIITAITRSGTNDLRGEIFGTYQDQSMIATDALILQNRRDSPNGDFPEPELTRYQYGAALGGPIVRDTLFFFASYEANIQDRASTVSPGGTPAQQAMLPFNVDDFRGTFVSPFREHLGFAKLTWQAGADHLVEVSGSLRLETDLRGFGGQAARERGESVNNDVYTGRLRWDWNGNGFVNEFSIDYLRSDLAFGALGEAGFGRVYQGVIQVGGRPQFQEVQQEGLTFRNNFSLTDVEWNGSHLIKMGARVSFQNYRVGGSGPFANPEFEFINNDRGTADPSDDLTFAQPSVVRFGGGDPEVEASTTQIGLFVQDDWEINEHLTLNLGLRWDVDTNARNNDFVTSPAAAQALRNLGADPRTPDFFDVEDYISTGDNRKTDWDNFAPRIGFSYDVNADQRTVIFGGFGRYYDRTLFRSAAEETLLRQYRQGELLFSDDGLPRDGRPTILFQPSYLTPAGFSALLASLAADPTSPGTSELRAIPNDLKTPYTDQFSIGVRQRFGIFRTSLSYSHIIGRDQIGYAPLNRTQTTNAGGFYDFIPMTNGFSNAVVAFNTRASRYDAVYLTVDKPYTRSSGWGGGIAYTMAWSRERGTSFNFDYPNIAAQDFVPNAGNERHRLVVNGMVDLPWGLRLSGLMTYGSGLPFFVIDANDGFQPGVIRLGYFEELPDFFQLDLRVQKTFQLFNSAELTLSAEVFNVTNHDNFGSADGFTCCGGNANFGKPNALAGPPRSFQLGAAFRF
ncbi:MAG TPA: TonB-dependent receptor [Allosphingosinicella sp.]|nr:TonB-dependent receptor [Allosphingosinicella sp.]